MGEYIGAVGEVFPDDDDDVGDDDIDFAWDVVAEVVVEAVTDAISNCSTTDLNLSCIVHTASVRMDITSQILVWESSSSRKESPSSHSDNALSIFRS